MNQNLFTGYWGVVKEGMTVPLAMFLDRDQAVEWAKTESAVNVREYTAASAIWQALRDNILSLETA